MSKNPYSPSTNPFMAGGNLPHPAGAASLRHCRGTSSCHSTNFWPQKRIIFCEVLRCHWTPPKKGTTRMKEFLFHPTSHSTWFLFASLESPKKRLCSFCGIYIPKNPLKAPWPKTTFFAARGGLGIFQEWSCHHRKLLHESFTIVTPTLGTCG